ncbi:MULTISPECIES: hypothetical protein [Sphingomonas]|uniref:CopG family transcriptional regulator n=1 Tax=Sphingomonas trueperi TaxID=53317 RepID=A0A7X5Y2W0_9SPHN|nr:MULTISPECIES: hypothetical protein [Sphingomonas]NJC00020.1 hypothetical protein [Sphingomonas trueperi]
MKKSELFQMRVTLDWLAQIDAWRSQQPDLPARAVAIRRLIEKALDQRTPSKPE